MFAALGFAAMMRGASEMCDPGLEMNVHVVPWYLTWDRLDEDDVSGQARFRRVSVEPMIPCNAMWSLIIDSRCLARR